MIEVAEGVWQSELRLLRFGIPFPRNMTVVKLPCGGLWLHSVNRLDAETKAAVDALGPVKVLVAPNKFHHFFVEDWVRAYPEAELYGAPGLDKKRADLSFTGRLGDTPPESWGGVFEQRVTEGAPTLHEVAFFHKPSKTAILCDFTFNMPEGLPLRTRFLFTLTGSLGGFKATKLFRRFVKDEAAVKSSVEGIAAWEPERVVMAHGVPVTEDATARLRAIFAGWG